MKKKPPTKKQKTPTLKDLITQCAADRRRMAEMSLHITTLYNQTAGLNERTDVMSRDIGALVKRANGVDQILSANATTHRKEVANLSTALDLLDSGQRTHAHMISELDRTTKQTQRELDVLVLSVTRREPPPIKEANLSEDDITSMANGLANLVRQRPSSEICSEGFRGTLREFIELFLKSRGGQ